MSNLEKYISTGVQYLSGIVDFIRVVYGKEVNCYFGEDKETSELCSSLECTNKSFNKNFTDHSKLLLACIPTEEEEGTLSFTGDIVIGEYNVFSNNCTDLCDGFKCSLISKVDRNGSINLFVKFNLVNVKGNIDNQDNYVKYFEKAFNIFEDDIEFSNCNVNAGRVCLMFGILNAYDYLLPAYNKVEDSIALDEFIKDFNDDLGNNIDNFKPVFNPNGNTRLFFVAKYLWYLLDSKYIACAILNKNISTIKYYLKKSLTLYASLLKTNFAEAEFNVSSVCEAYLSNSMVDGMKVFELITPLTTGFLKIKSFDLTYMAKASYNALMEYIKLLDDKNNVNELFTMMTVLYLYYRTEE